jgi:poly(glycerol-phosphate) alpha-glucosyltransferase
MLDAWALQNSGWKKRLAATFFENENLKSAACLHALNPAEEMSIRDYGYRGPVCVIPNGVDLPASDEAPPEMPWWNKSAPQVKTLLYLGRVHPKKGLPNLLLAWSRLEPDFHRSWRLVIAGWDENGHQLALRRMTTALRIEQSVFFPGPLFGDEKRGAYYYCDGFVLPSLSEGLPMVVLEAWACGKPVLMTAKCNLPEGFEAGAAVCIEPSEESIAEVLGNFMTTGEAERAAIGANGRTLVGRRFAWPVIAADMAGVYRWVVGVGPRPALVTLP